ncbi:MAG TPA: prepilin-type N-terminal cleavage/methylation domain-containing protein [Bryobacterales bacterium]|nr:prepilin-type N-terminal cleavage/methylation domain-containing protein [Bryobacterales bacterium]
MRRPARREAGLTLIEVMVAIALLSVLSVGILMALRVGTAAWERATDGLMLDRRIAAANNILQQELEGIFPAWAEFVNPATRAQGVVIFFQGEPGSMRFVTAYSLDSGPRGGLRIVELLVAQGPKGQRVLLNELPYTGPRSAGQVVRGVTTEGAVARPVFAPIAVLPASFVIADELGSCSFSYLEQNEPGAMTGPPRWVSSWRDAERLPAAISIQITPGQGPARLQPVTVTVPIRATMTP